MGFMFPKYVVMIFVLCFSVGIGAMSPYKVQAQCSASTPVFDVNLNGQPNGVWTSPLVNRDGTCCTADKNDRCVQFNIILDKNAGGLQFDIVSGPVPSGSMFYQVDCGPIVAVGQPICVTGPGPHKLSICMPGNAANGFMVKSIAAFVPVPDISVTAGCFSTLQAPTAFFESSVSWRDITGGGTYNNYLSCTSGCSTPTVTPDDNPPAFVDYVVCGNSQASLCATLPYCDTVRVYFYPPPVVTISPQPAIICPGSSGVELTGNVTGGSGNFSYFWTNSQGTVVATTQKYMATSVGIYQLEVRNENYPNCRKFASSVTVVNDLAVNAGPDQAVCAQNNVQLAGAVSGASGAVWSGGAGTFSPDRTTGNAVYTPTAAELAAGTLTLTLTSTGNGNCAPVRDEVRISFYSVSVNLTGTATICAGSTGTVSASVSGGIAPLQVSWNTGETGLTLTNKPGGSYTVTISDGKGCSVSQSFTITERAGPEDFTTSVTAATCGGANGQIAVESVTGGTAPYTYSRNGTSFQASSTFAGLTAGSYTITVKDATGCTIAKPFTVQNLTGPTAVAASAEPATCADNDGRITAGAVTGGTSPYTYSINGTSFQAGTVFAGIASGSYTLTARDANGCLVTTSLAVGKVAPTAFSSSTLSSVCGQSTGQLTITAITGGTGPYTYSRDGINFQTSATFTGLAANSYTITVKDAKGCTYARQVQVSDLSGPTGLTATSKASTCSNSNGEISVQAVSGGTGPYTYSLGGSTYQASANFTALAAGDHEVYVKDANGCIYSKRVQIADIAGPAFTAVVKSATCGNSNGEISASAVTGGTAPFQYSIDGITFQSSTTYGNLAPGPYILRVKDANGCLAAEAVVLEGIAGPSDFEATTVSSTCGGANGQIAISAVSDGTSPYLYALNGGAFQSSANFALVRAGEHTVTVKDANGCTFSKKVRVGDISGPSGFSANTKSSTCGQSDGALTVSAPQGGISPYAFSLDGGAFQSSATFAGLSARAYTVIVKDANGCTYAQSVVVNDLAGATAISAATTPASCVAEDGTITIQGVTGGTSPYAYSLDGTTFGGSGTFTSLAPSDYTIHVKDANGCRSTFTVRVGAKGIQKADIVVTQAACGQANGAIKINSVSGGTGPYAYSLDGDAFQASATFQNLEAGSYRLTIKDIEDCTFSLVANITNAGGPESFVVTESDARCGNNNGSLLVSQISGGQSPYTYSLDGTAFQNSPEFTGLAEGIYQVRVKDSLGCIMIKSALIQSSEPLSERDLKVSVTSADCIQGTGQVVVEQVSGGTGPYLYSLDGRTFTSSSTLSGIAPGSYLLSVKDAKECVITTNVKIETMTARVASVQNISCSGGADGRIIISTNGKKEKTEYSIDGGVKFQQDSVFTNLGKGTYTIVTRFSATCSLTVGPVNVKEPEAIDAQVTQLTKAAGTDNPGSAMVKVMKGGKRPFAYQLNNGSFGGDSLFTNLSAGTHSVVVKDANGCTTTLSLAIEEALADIEIPNGFTPNGDGINDRWALKNLARYYPQCKVTVFNRWGSQVFYSAGYSREWDGTYNGQPLPDGTYYFIIELGSSEPTIKKSVTIMR
jgi:large repetitive protein